MRLALNQSLTLSGGFSQATALLAIAAADYKNEKKEKKVTITPEDEQEAVNSLDNLFLTSDDEYFVDLDPSFNERETT